MNLINPYILVAPISFLNDYAMAFVANATPASMQIMSISSRSTDIRTAITSATAKFTVTGYFKVNSTQGTSRSIFSKYDNFAGVDRCFLIYMNPSNKLEVYGQWNSASASVSLVTTATYTSTSTWVHFAFVYDYSQTTGADIAKLYVNGVLVTSFTTQTVSTTNKYFMDAGAGNGAKITLGCYYAGATQNLPTAPFGGNLDEISFWNAALTAAEITELYNGGVGYNLSLMANYSAAAQGWWRMGDYSGDAFNGTNWDIDSANATTNNDMLGANLAVGARVAF